MPKRARSCLTSGRSRRRKKNDVFMVQEVMDHRKVGDKMEYKVSWMGYPNEPPTWEPEDHLLNNCIWQTYATTHGLVEIGEEALEGAIGGQCEGTSKPCEATSHQVENGEPTQERVCEDQTAPDWSMEVENGEPTQERVCEDQAAPEWSMEVENGEPTQERVCEDQAAPDWSMEVADLDVTDIPVLLHPDGTVTMYDTGATGHEDLRSKVENGEPTQERVCEDQAAPERSMEVENGEPTQERVCEDQTAPEWSMEMSSLTEASEQFDAFDNPGPSTWRPVRVGKDYMLLMSDSCDQTANEVIQELKEHVESDDEEEEDKEKVNQKNGARSGKLYICHLCGMNVRNSRPAQHLKRRHHITSKAEITKAKRIMLLAASKISKTRTRKEVVTMEPLPCPLCESSVLHLFKHLLRKHGVADARERKALVDRVKGKQKMSKLQVQNEESETLEEETEEVPGDDSTTDKFLKDPMISAYISTQTGWTEDSKKHWSNKRARLLARLVAKCADPEATTCVQALLQDATLDRIEQELKSTCHSQPALCKSQVIALHQFCSHVQSRTPELKTRLEAVLARIEEWKVKVAKEDRKREAKIQHKMSDEGFLPSTEELGKFRNSCGQDLKKFIAGERKENYTNAVHLRRILEAKVLLHNFNRAGPVTNATLEEYHRMERTEDGGAVLSVERHKSSATHGPANLPLTPDVVRGLDLYVSKYRNLLQGQDKTLLFVSAKPDRDLKDLALTYSMEALANKLTPTNLRKVAATSARSTLNDAECEKLANLMCHQPDTQRRHYAAKQRKTANISVANRMQLELFGSDSAATAAPDSSAAAGAPSSPRQHAKEGKPKKAEQDQKRRPFSYEETQALVEGSRSLSEPVTIVQAASMKIKYPVLANRSTKVVYNKLREFGLLRREKRLV